MPYCNEEGPENVELSQYCLSLPESHGLLVHYARKSTVITIDILFAYPRDILAILHCLASRKLRICVGLITQ